MRAKYKTTPMAKYLGKYRHPMNLAIAGGGIWIALEILMLRSARLRTLASAPADSPIANCHDPEIVAMSDPRLASMATLFAMNITVDMNSITYSPHSFYFLTIWVTL
ncbi:unnamed protein product [marine sediment metagenome]|uniref:Uncharacterized protein n=1 Tax=marine sediment metagenome TaxID=412755 RepID=X1VGQ7_9ZZZZ